MNSDAVVALASSTFKGNSSQEASMLRSSPTTPFQYGVDGQLHDRTVPILDALAELCVHDPCEDVVAIGLRLNLPDVQLLIATNDVKPNETTLTHIKEIWSLLKQISDLHFFDKADELQNVKMDALSPELSFEAGQKQFLYNKLLRLVYQYGYLKVCHRRDKYWKTFVRFLEAAPDADFSNLDEDDQSLLSNVISFLQHLKTISSMINDYHSRNWSVSNHEMDSDFTPYLTRTLDDAKRILDDLTGCERLTEIVNVDCEF
jgi:hypothetical protein